MNIIKKVNFLSNNRYLHLSEIYHGEGRAMKKIMGGTKKRKFKYHERPLLPAPSTLSVGANEGKKSSNSRRTSVLNKLFMRYITDLMSTGECSTVFVGHGIEINRVQVTPDFSCVQLYWTTNSLEKDDIIENILNENVGKLRHELAQLKVVGLIPRLKFVKDKQFAKLAEVDRLLAVADYGEDYVPVDLGSKLKTQLQILTGLDTNVVKQIEKLDMNADPEDFDDLPPMPNNVFGLNHTTIMEHIESATKKSQAWHRVKSTDEDESLIQINTSPILLASAKEEKEAFQQFIEQQQILKNKAKKEMKNNMEELEYLREELIRQQGNVENQITNEDNDFIDDDFDSDNK